MRRIPRLSIAFLGTLLLAATAHARQEVDEPLSSLLEGRVSFTLPAAWAVKRHTSLKTQGHAQLDIPGLGEKRDPLPASLSANVVPEQVGVRHLSDGVYKNRFEGLAVLSDTVDGDNWRTVVWTAKSDWPILALQRFGVVNRVAVEVLVLLRLPEGGDLKPAERIFAEFNDLCASLKVDRQNHFAHPVRLAAVAEKLKEKR